MKKRISPFVLFAFILAASLIPLCPGTSGTEEAPVIEYIGSSTVGKFIKEAAKVYTKASFTLNTKVESGGGERATAMGKAGLGGVAREVGKTYIDKGVKPFLIGKDAIGVWVNEKNPVSDLTKEQLSGIFCGDITNWKAVGGEDLSITVYIVDVNSATRKVFTQSILGKERYGGRIKLTRPDAGIIDRVANDPGGIGHLSFALGTGHPKEKAVRKLSIDGQAPVVSNPTYPVTRPLYLITKGAPTEPAKSFIDWALSPEGQMIVKKYFVGI